MKRARTLLQTVMTLLALWLAAYSSSLRAEDIDIYVDNAASNGDLPNVLFVIDNSANLASTWNGGGCSAYKGTTEAPALGTGTAGGVIQCALVDAINSLPDGALNIGILVGTNNGYATTVAPGATYSHETCTGGADGGCLLRQLELMSSATGKKQNLVKFIKSWSKNGTSSTTFDLTINSAKSGQMMQEAWAYYNGKTGLSGKTYTPSLLHGCQKNFIIYIGNTDKTPDNDDPSYSGSVGLASNVVGATTGQKEKITEAAKFNPAICGNITQQPAVNNANDWSSNWGDEWARLMFQQDGGAAGMEGAQNIVTYGIGIINNGANQCTADYPALLSSMAKFGGGKYFSVGNASEMTAALMAALNEVQAVNSVFSSASLPVSVNAEGSYLNQIFLGMFRPDQSGAPRWMGNLKQYHLIRNSTGALVMGDATNKQALSSGGTGFLAPDAVSFWTYRQDAVLPDKEGGFFVNDKKGTPVQGYDRADGEVVEKGGVAQILRKQNLTADFSGAGGTTGNPRRVFTYCPSGSDCNPDLTDASNDFSTANGSISAVTFGSTITVPVSSIVRNGTSALVTTRGNHGFKDGSVVTIRNAVATAYNVTQAIRDVGPTTFTITDLPDWPTSPSRGTYTVSRPGTSTATYSISAISRTVTTSGPKTTTTAPAKETVTVTTVGTHTFRSGDFIKISGVTPEINKPYNLDGWQVTSATDSSLTFQMPVHPTATSTAPGSFRVVRAPYTITIDGIGVSNNGKVATVGTTSAHSFHVGQMVTISGVTSEPQFNGTWEVKSVTTTGFTIDSTALNKPKNGGTGSVMPSTQGQPPVTLVRTGSTVSTYAVVTGIQPNWFVNGDKVNITNATVPANESGYLATDVTITCIATDCSSFSYPIKASPDLSANASGTVSASGGAAVIAQGDINRIGNDKRTVEVKNIPANLFKDGETLEISPTGTQLASESAYVGTWTIRCGVDTTCSTFTLDRLVDLTPPLRDPGANIQAYSGSTSPDKDALIKWLRGQDNAGDEKGPGNGITVRGSVHGDVLHSRPLVVNYGDSRGIVVFYGSNDGVYRAVNGNTSQAIGSVPAGGELWGLILPEHYNLINRYRSNAPELKFPSSLLASAQPKDYFVDGPTGVYQKLNADNTISKAIVYLTMRRGGRFIYALDVTQPDAPRYLWRVSAQTPGFEELGQTWSRPRLTLLQNHKTAPAAGGDPVPTPVLVFGAGYDPAQDAEPPSGDSMGRGIFVVNALTGELVWSASKSCDTLTGKCIQVAGMAYATPSDVTFVDRDLNGFTDKIYWGDLGGNVWRADVSDASVANWKVSRVAQLGCDTGECASGTTPRKFFFPPAVLSVRTAGSPNSYEALSIVSGDREHPLRSEAAESAYNVQDKFFMIKDAGTTVGAPSGTPSTVDVTASDTDLFNATDALYDNSKKGFSIKLEGDVAAGLKGEKGVNAPIAVNGQIFFSTNRPVPRSNMCAPNLGEAKAYAVSPFTGKSVTNVLAGGGLPPSAVAGLITVTTTNPDGTTTDVQEKFCIGCGVSGSQTGGTNTTPCTSALENCSQGTVIPKNLKRTYWYKK